MLAFKYLHFFNPLNPHSCHTKLQRLGRRAAIITRLRLVAIPSLFIVPCLLTVNHAVAESTRVDIQEFQQIAVFPQRSAPARVVSLNDTQLSAQLNAIISSISVRVGDTVKKGDTLATLDCRDYELAKQRDQALLDAATAANLLAEQQFSRSTALYKNKLTSKDDLNIKQANAASTTANVMVATSTLAASTLNVARCQVISPVNGWVSARLASEGQLANIGTPIIELIDSENPEISAQFFASDADSLQQSSDIQFISNETRLPVTLRRIVPRIDPTTRNREARLEFIDQQALQGASGKIIWQESQPHVASDILVVREQKRGIFIVDEKNANTATFVHLPTAQSGKANPVSLPENALIITNGFINLNDGDDIDYSGNASVTIETEE